MSTKVAIVCSGAIGGYVGGHMTKAGEDVTLIDMYPDHVEQMRNNALEITGVLPRDNVTTKVKALHVSEVQGLSKERPIDVAFITAKSYDTPWAAALIKPYLAEHGFCVSLQNSINEEAIASVVGWDRTVGVAISGLGVELFAPGRIKRTQFGAEGHVVFRSGEVHGRITPRVEEVARLLSAADAAKTTTNLWGERWSKLIVNAMRNGLAAVTDMGGPEQDSNEITRWIMIRLGSEAVRVGQALGYTLEKAQGMDTETLARAGEGDKAALKTITDMLLEGSKRRSDDNRPSMAQDVAKGRRTEIDQMNGMIARRGAEMGVNAPVNAAINQLVQKVYRGEVKAGLDAVRGI